MIVKNISYFLLEPKEFQILRQATISDIQDKSGIEYLIGVWKNFDSNFMVASIYQIVSASNFEVVYLNELFDYCRIGDLVSGLPENFHEVKRISIK